MDARHKELGRHVREERERQGYRSRAALATDAGIGERSVAKVELGDTTVGAKTLTAIARALGYPPKAFVEFLRTGDRDLLAPPQMPESAQSRGEAEVSRILSMSKADLLDEAECYDDIVGEGAGEEWLRWALEVRRKATKNIQRIQAPR